MALRRSRLPENPTGPTLGNVEYVTDVTDDSAPPGRAQKFSDAASLRIELSSAWSATSFLSRTFSFSNSFRRFA
jgi:hypothetical protein